VKSDLTDLQMVIHARTARAVLVSDDGDKKRAVWLPLSQCETTDEPLGCEITVTMPEWLATEKGLV
jgi:hypothetical protein